MRCIDADALRDRLQNLGYDDWNQGATTTWAEAFSECADMVEEMPTIEPRCETCEAFNKTRLLIPQPQQRWIPCSKELPERNLVVLVTTRWGEVTEGVKLSGNAWFIGRGEENAFDSDIIAWMPKPEPYKEGGAV